MKLRWKELRYSSVLSSNLLSAVIKIKRDSTLYIDDDDIFFTISLRFVLSHQHIYKNCPHSARTSRIKDTRGVNSIYDFFFRFFRFLFLSSSVHQAKWKCRYFQVVVDTEREATNCFETKVCDAVAMDLRNLKSVFVIAEIGQNHQGDIRVAKDVINISGRFRLSSLISLISFLKDDSSSVESRCRLREVSKVLLDREIHSESSRSALSFTKFLRLNLWRAQAIFGVFHWAIQGIERLCWIMRISLQCLCHG